MSEWAWRRKYKIQLGEISFTQFAKAIVAGARPPPFDHFLPQYAFIYDEITGRMLVDFVGRFETLAQDFEYIKQVLDLPKDLILPTVQSSEHSNYRDYYDEETKLLVAHLYAKDIMLFNYHF